MTPLRVAIVGGGMIAAVHRRAALLAGAQVSVVLGSSPERSAEIARDWGVETAAGSIEELLADRPDVVHVCTPNATHVAYARAALEAGCHVVCEKPLATSVEDAEALATLAETAGLVATVPFVYRFHPLVREIRARVAAGELGTVHLVHGSYLQDWLLDPAASSWRVFEADGGPSRAFADIGSHWCDLVEFVTGRRFTELVADLRTVYGERPVSSGASFGGANGGDTAPVTTEDAATVLLRTADGVPGSVVISQVSAGRKNRLWFEIDGERQCAVFDQENPESVWLGGEASSTVLVRDGSQGSPDARRLSSLPAGHAQGYAQCFESFVADTYAAVRGEVRDGLPTFADGARSAHLIDAVLRSAASRAWTEIA